MKIVSAPIKTVIFVTILTVLALYVSVPNEFSLFGRKIIRPAINIQYGKLDIQKI